MPGKGSSAHRVAGVAGSRRHENLVQAQALLQIRDQKRVLEETAAQTNLVDAGAVTEVLKERADHVSDGGLETAGQRAAFVVTQVGLAVAYPHAVIKLGGEGQTSRQPAIYVTVVQAGQVILGIAQHVKKHVLEDRLAFQAEPLGLVFVMMRKVAEQVCYLRIDPGQRVRKGNGAQHTDAGSFAHCHHAGMAVPFAIQGQDKGAIIGRQIESVGGVAEMMLEVQDVGAAAVALQSAHLLQFAGNHTEFDGLVVGSRHR